MQYMDKKMTIFLTIAISFLLLGAGCVRNDSNAQKTEVEISVLNDKATNTDTILYRNTAYDYSFTYPKNLSVGSNNMGYTEYEASHIAVSDESQYYLHVESNPVTIKEEKYVDPESINLKDFVTIIYENNKNETNPPTKVGPLQTTTVGGKIAYAFTLEGTYSQNGRGNGGTLSPGKHLFILTENNKTKYMIYYREGVKISEDILATFTFINTTALQTYNNTQYGFTFQYPNKGIIAEEPGDTIGDGLLAVNFLSTDNTAPGDRNIYSGLRVFLNNPSIAFGYVRLEDALKNRKIQWDAFQGFSKEYQWQCGDSENRGGDKIRSCYLQKGKNVYLFDYMYYFNTILSRKDFDGIVSSFYLQ